MSLVVTPVRLRGERSELIPLEQNHAADLWRVGNDSRIWQYMPYQVQSEGDTERWVKEALDGQRRGVELPFIVIDRWAGEIVGSTRLADITPAHRAAEIGWTWYSPAVWRTRINTECKYLLLRHCFETLGMIRVWFKVDARNERSRNAVLRIGAVQEGILRSHRILPDGYRRDSVVFSVIEPEWPEIKVRLERFLAADHSKAAGGESAREVGR